MEIRTITRRAQSALEDLNKEFGSLYTRRDFDHKLADLKDAEGMTNYLEVLSELEKMMAVFDIHPKKHMDNAKYYADLLRDVEIPEYEEVRDKMLMAIFKKLPIYASPQDYMKRMVDTLEDPKDGWRDDPLRVRILKQFIKYGDYLQGICHKNANGSIARDIGGKAQIVRYVQEKIGHRPTNQEVWENVDDGIFAKLEGAARDQLRPRGMFGLLKIVNDLAQGYFRMEGNTKRALYYFAIVYNMTYYIGADDNGPEVFDAKTDVDANLFRDYYVNNLMRYLSPEYRSERSRYQADPSGQGINYKNYAEMVYLYYIRKDLTAVEKLQKANDMINELADSGNGGRRLDGGTKTYRGLVHGVAPDGETDVLTVMTLREDEFKAFLKECYDCCITQQVTDKNGKVTYNTINPIQIALEQNTAYELYKETLQTLREDYEITLDKCNYGLMFAELDEMHDYADEFLEKHPDITAKQFKDYTGLLESFDSFIKAKAKGENDSEEENESSLDVKNANDMTRTSLLTALYYLYNAMLEANGSRWRNFKELFEDFRDTVDPQLEEAYYQPLSAKNIFDVMLVFSSYAYMNL